MSGFVCSIPIPSDTSDVGVDLFNIFIDISRYIFPEPPDTRTCSVQHLFLSHVTVIITFLSRFLENEEAKNSMIF